MRGGRLVRLKANADVALQECPTVEKVIVVKRTDGIDMEPNRDIWWHEEMKAHDIANYCEPEQMDAEDPLFILYTSGSTGKPKACFTQQAVICFSLTLHSDGYSIIMMKTSISAQQT